MKRLHFLILSTLLAVSSITLFLPSTATASQPKVASANSITGTGKVCNNEGVCVDFQLTFNPAGGDVTGTYSGVFTYHIQYAGLSEIVQTETETGTLTGTYSGGDGGGVKGTASFTTTNVVAVTNGVSSPQSDSSGAYRPWKGVLNADGTGAGTIECCQEYSATGIMIDNPWTITFSAQDFQNGLAVSTPTEGNLVATTGSATKPAQDATPKSSPVSKGIPFCGAMILPLFLLFPKLIRGGNH